MATKTKKSAAKKVDSNATVTRITAKTASKKSTKKSPTTTQTKKTVTPPVEPEKMERKNPLVAIGAYFAGAWYELRQVRWPNRKATWGMTAAMLGFTAFFVVIILLLDAAFKYLFEVILG